MIGLMWFLRFWLHNSHQKNNILFYNLVTTWTLSPENENEFQNKYEGKRNKVHIYTTELKLLTRSKLVCFCCAGIVSSASNLNKCVVLWEVY